MFDKLRKGITVATWIWIIAGVIIAFTVFTVAYFNIGLLQSQANRQEVKDSFQRLRDQIDFACSNAPGYKKPNIRYNFHRTRAIYVSERVKEPDPKVAKFISEGKNSSGSYICVSFQEDDFSCLELDCETNMTYMGTPLKGSDMYELGVEDGSFEFEVTIEKSDIGKVEVIADHLP